MTNHRWTHKTDSFSYDNHELRQTTCASTGWPDWISIGSSEPLWKCPRLRRLLERYLRESQSDGPVGPNSYFYTAQIDRCSPFFNRSNKIYLLSHSCTRVQSVWVASTGVNPDTPFEAFASPTWKMPNSFTILHIGNHPHCVETLRAETIRGDSLKPSIGTTLLEDSSYSTRPVLRLREFQFLVRPRPPIHDSCKI